MQRVLLFHPEEHESYRSLLAPRSRDLDLDIVATADPEVARREVPRAEILIAANTFPVEALSGAERLRWVHVQGAGVDRWIEADLAPGVRVTRTVGTFGPRMAEYAMAHLLAVHHRLHDYREDQAARRWKKRPATALRGRRLGIAGFGAIGSTLAQRAAAFEMEVVGLARSEKPGGSFRVYPQEQLHAFLADLDVVVNTLPLTSASRCLFDASAFDAMMPGAWFLNMGRGGTVEESALIDSLQSGHLGGAILDVFEVEPLPADSPLWTLPNVIVTPHISGPTLPEEVVEVFLANLPRFRDGAALLDEVERATAY